MVRVYFHLHTEYSKCSNIKLEKWAEIIEKEKNSIFIITDHDTIRGAQILKKRFPDKVIVGEEIKTKKGELIGVFLKNEVRSSLDVSETIKDIHDQGGLVILPHPCDRLRKEPLKMDEILKNIEEIDIIEVFNSRVVFREDNKKALELADKYKKPFIFGSDAHFVREVNLVYFEMSPFENNLEFEKSLKKVANFKTKKGDILSHFLTFLRKRNLLK